MLIYCRDLYIWVRNPLFMNENPGKTSLLPGQKMEKSGKNLKQIDPEYSLVI